MAKQRPPAEFAEILNSPEQPIIVGGQAVNVWAEYFSARNRDLAARGPFVSKDADILGDRALAARLASTTGWKVNYFYEPRTFAVAVLTKELPDNETLTVEVLREVKGLKTAELGDCDLVEVSQGRVYRIPSPIRLLRAKVANVRDIKPTREQDVHHVRLLVTLAHDYLKEQLEQVARGRLSERQWINAFHDLRNTINDRSSQELDRQFAFGLERALPASIATGLPKITALYQHLDQHKKRARRIPP